MAGSFAQSVNAHGCKRARWRRLRRQQIQDWLIAACQNVKILVQARRPGPLAVEMPVMAGLARSLGSALHELRAFVIRLGRFSALTSVASFQLS
jgi:hypothetical protein